MTPEDLEAARRAREEDVSRLAQLDMAQVDYLARLQEVPDPKSDGLACFDREGHDG